MERMVQSGRAGRSVRVQPALPRAGGDDFNFDDVLYPQGWGEGMPDAGGALAVLQWDNDMEESVECLPQAGGAPHRRRPEPPVPAGLIKTAESKTGTTVLQKRTGNPVAIPK